MKHYYLHGEEEFSMRIIFDQKYVYLVRNLLKSRERSQKFHLNEFEVLTDERFRTDKYGAHTFTKYIYKNAFQIYLDII